MSVTEREIESQPELWGQAVEIAHEMAAKLPGSGERIAVIGCGTSYHVAKSVAAAREARKLGESDAFPASEFPTSRSYGAVLAISRSGTTTEVVRSLSALPEHTRSVAICAVPETPVVAAATDTVLLAFADEQSIVQTRFATTTLALMRAWLGEDLGQAIADAHVALSNGLPVDPADFEQFVFLGRGWTVGLAAEAALKFREAAGAWAEAYPAMEYRHGPISAAGPGTVVWWLGTAEPDLLADVRATGAAVVESELDPMAQLVTLQRAAVALAEARGLDPDHPAHLSRSVVLP